MREKIVYEANIPQLMALADDNSVKLCPGVFKYGKQQDDSYQWFLDGDKITWVNPLVEAKRKALDIKTLEPFTVTRRLKAGSSLVDWQVQRVGAGAEEPASRLEAQLGASVQQVAAAKATKQYQKILDEQAARKAQQQKTAASVPAPAAVSAALALPTQSIHAVPMSSSDGASQQPQRSRPLIQSAMIAAVDALIVAKEYAQSKGMHLEIYTEDIRAVANTLYIQHARDGQRAS